VEPSIDKDIPAEELFCTPYFKHFTVYSDFNLIKRFIMGKKMAM